MNELKYFEDDDCTWPYEGRGTLAIRVAHCISSCAQQLFASNG